jgi:GT2 family glycosyltransferase
MDEMSNRLVGIVIVTAGKNNYIESCLDSVTAQTHPKLEIIAIDNSVNQDFSQQVRRHYPEINLFSSPKNLFYCQALNRGIEMSNGDFILCLNDDVILDERFIEEALKGFDIDARIGMVSGKILRSDGKIIDSTGLSISIWRTAKERGYGKKDIGQFEKSRYIFGVNGAVSFYRRKMLVDIKLGSDYFDSDLRIFYEDLDIAWRAHKFGWKGYYIPGAIAYHIRGGTVRQGKGMNKRYARHFLSDNLHFDLFKNRYLTIIKNETFLGFLLHLPFIVIYDIFLWSYLLIFKFSVVKIILSKKIPISSAFRKRTLLKKLNKTNKTC